MSRTGRSKACGHFASSSYRNYFSNNLNAIFFASEFLRINVSIDDFVSHVSQQHYFWDVLYSLARTLRSGRQSSQHKIPFFCLDEKVIE